MFQRCVETTFDKTIKMEGLLFFTLMYCVRATPSKDVHICIRPYIMSMCMSYVRVPINQVMYVYVNSIYIQYINV